MRTASTLTNARLRKGRTSMHKAKAAALPVPSEPAWSKPQQRLLAVLRQPENRTKSGVQICREAGYSTSTPWQQAIKDEQFVAAVEALGVTIRQHHLPSQLDVE